MKKQIKQKIILALLCGLLVNSIPMGVYAAENEIIDIGEAEYQQDVSSSDLVSTEEETERTETERTETERTEIEGELPSAVFNEEIPVDQMIGRYSYTPFPSAPYNLQFDLYSDTEIIITGYSGQATGTLVIPDNIYGIKVVAIGSFTFSNCSGFTGNLTIPSTIRIIQSYAFSNCSGFTGDLIIPNGVKYIESNAFSGCSGFSGKLVIPNGVETIGSWAFSKCSGLTGVLHLPNTVLSIADYAFYECNGFTGDLIIPNSVLTVGKNAFGRCNGFSGKLVLSNNMKTINSDTFYYCSGLKGNIIIPKQIATVGENAFYMCSGFDGYLVIPESVSTIGSNAFYGCSGLMKDIFIKEKTSSIGRNAFAFYSLTSKVTIHAPEGSYAQSYARTNGHGYVVWKYMDVEPNSWQYKGITYVSGKGMMSGYSETKFGTNNNLTREQFAVVLHNYEKKPNIQYSNVFSDVPDGQWFSQAVIWVYDTNIASGYPNGKFGVNDNITREQFVTMLYGYAKSKGYISNSTEGNLANFTDANKVSPWAYEALVWAVDKGLMSGKGQGNEPRRIDPQGNTTRAECATMMMQFDIEY